MIYQPRVSTPKVCATLGPRFPPPNSLKPCKGATWLRSMSDVPLIVACTCPGVALGFYVTPFQGFVRVWRSITQGVALGWYIAPFQGLLRSRWKGACHMHFEYEIDEFSRWFSVGFSRKTAPRHRT
jgi:hypothetical protein